MEQGGIRGNVNITENPATPLNRNLYSNILSQLSDQNQKALSSFLNKSDVNKFPVTCGQVNSLLRQLETLPDSKPLLDLKQQLLLYVQQTQVPSGNNIAMTANLSSSANPQASIGDTKPAWLKISPLNPTKEQLILEIKASLLKNNFETQREKADPMFNHYFKQFDPKNGKTFIIGQQPGPGSFNKGPVPGDQNWMTETYAKIPESSVRHDLSLCQTLGALWGAKSSADIIRDKFYFGKKDDPPLVFDEKSEIAKLISNEPGFIKCRNTFEDAAIKYYREHGNLDQFNGDAILNRVNPGHFNDQLASIAVLGGYNYLTATVNHISNHEVSVTYTIADNFGADIGDADRKIPGVSALYYLQHYGKEEGYTYQPFIWSVNIKTTHAY